MILASIGVALMLPNDIIARATAMFMGLCASAFLPMFTYGLFSKRPSALAAKLSLVVGAAVWFFWTAFVHIKESDPLGLCEWIFGKPALLEMPWQAIDPLVIAMPLAILALVVGWYFDPARREAPAPSVEPA
jgi:SSS family solute:Na+ symporter